MLVSHSGPGVLPSVRQMEPSESASSSNLSLAKARPSSELNGQSPSHLKVQRSVSSNHKQRRYSEQGERPAGGRGPPVTSAALMVILPDVQRAALTHRPSPPPAVGQNVPPGMSHPKRSPTTTAENSAKEEGGVQMRKPSAPPASPLLGNANNPNKADIPDRRKGATTGPSVSRWTDVSLGTLKTISLI